MVERRTAQGKILDMESLMAEQPETIAAGNAGVNAFRKARGLSTIE